MIKSYHKWLVLGLSALLLLAIAVACAKAPAPTPTVAAPTQVKQAEPTQVPLTTAPPTQAPTAVPPTLAPSATPVPATVAPTPVPPTPTTAPIKEPPAEAHDIGFQASDGQKLKGTFYPAASNTAPMVVLMHWAPGDQTDWVEIAYWLQNRGLGGKSPNPENAPWLDPTWFPPLPEGWAFSVFSFTFRGCEGGCQEFAGEGWLLDAQAAMQLASVVAGGGRQQMVAIGASIGSDGAADGCVWLNDQQRLGDCLGALSLSPGSYLTVPYADAVTALGEDDPARPAWCLYAEGDTDSAATCESASGDNYRLEKYADSHHGMMLVQPDLDPNALQLILDFIGESLGLE